MEQQALGKRIREERLKLNLTQERLAEDVNLSTAYIGQIERGERSLTLENLAAVANRLGVTIDYLLSDSVVSDSDGQYRQDRGTKSPGNQYGKTHVWLSGRKFLNDTVMGKIPFHRESSPF